MRRTPPALPALIAVLALVAPAVGAADALGLVSVEPDVRPIAAAEPAGELERLTARRSAQEASRSVRAPSPSPSPSAAPRAVTPARPSPVASAARPAPTRAASRTPVPATPPRTSGGVARGSDDYPWRTSTSDAPDDWGFTRRQCTSFVAYRLARAGRALDNGAEGWGDAAGWDDVARARGRAVTAAPAVGMVAHWAAGEASAYYAGGAASGSFRAGPSGHVGWVTHVYADGSVQVEGYNATGDRSWSSLRVRAPRFLRL